MCDGGAGIGEDGFEKGRWGNGKRGCWPEHELCEHSDLVSGKIQLKGLSEELRSNIKYILPRHGKN